MDVITADLDGGSVSCPINLEIPQLPDPYYTEVVDSLFHVINFLS